MDHNEIINYLLKKLKESDQIIDNLKEEKRNLIEYIREQHSKPVQRPHLIITGNKQYYTNEPLKKVKGKKTITVGYPVERAEEGEILTKDEKNQMMRENMVLALQRHFEKGDGKIELKTIRKVLEKYFLEIGIPELKKKHRCILDDVLLDCEYNIQANNEGTFVTGIITHPGCNTEFMNVSDSDSDSDFD